MGKPKHPRPEGRSLFGDAEKQGWVITWEGKYPKMKCPCPKRHLTTVHLTPSNPNYWNEKRRRLSRITCWKEPQQ